MGETAHDEFVAIRDNAALERDDEARIELVVEDAAADDVAVVEETDTVMGFGPGRLFEEGAAADLAADDAFGFKIFEGLDDGD